MRIAEHVHTRHNTKLQANSIFGLLVVHAAVRNSSSQLQKERRLRSCSQVCARNRSFIAYPERVLTVLKLLQEATRSK